MSNDFVALDYACTELCEIAKIVALKFSTDKIGERFECEISENSPSLSETLKRLCDFVGDSKIVMFDSSRYGAIRAIGEKYGIEFPVAIDDVVGFAQEEVFGDSKRFFDIRMLSDFFGLDCKADVIALTAQLFVKLIEKQHAPKKPSSDVCFTPLYSRILRRNELRDSTHGIDAEKEIKILQRASLGEAFMLLVDMLDALRDKGIAYKLNGAVNMSKLAYLVGITEEKPGFYDYYFSRLVNPYKSTKTKAPSLCVSIDVEPKNVQTVVKLMRDFYADYNTNNTLFVVQVTDYVNVPEEYTFAERYNKAILDISVSPSEELARFTAMRKETSNLREISGNDIRKYILSTPIKVFDDAEEYLRILQAINGGKIKFSIEESVALALAVVQSGNKDAEEHIKDFVQSGGKMLRPADIVDALFCSCGFFMYQEQAMRILCELSGCSQYYADNIRRAMTKRDVKALMQYEQAFLFGGEDVDGMRFGGCLKQDRMISGRNYWAEICEVMPKMYLKAHMKARAKFFIDCAKLQMLSEE